MGSRLYTDAIPEQESIRILRAVIMIWDSCLERLAMGNLSGWEQILGSGRKTL